MENQEDAARQVELNPSVMVERVDNWLDGFVRLVPNILVALVLLAVFWFAAQWIGALVRRAGRARGRENLGAVLGSFARWSAFLVGALLALTVVLPTLNPGDLLAGLGVGSVAIGFAFKDILQNWLAGILLLLRQPFSVGDQIKVDSFEGTVERIESRATLLRTYDNQRVVIPNSSIYTNSVTVRTAFKLRRSEYEVGIGYSDDIALARKVILEAVSSVEVVADDPAPEVLPWALDASWVTIRLWWWSKPDQASVVHARTAVLVAVKRALDEAGIDLPFETQIQLFHDQTEEFDGDRARQREGWPAPKSSRPPRPARLADKAQE